MITEVQQVGPNKFLMLVPQASRLQHLCIFLTQPLADPTMAVGIFYTMVDTQHPQTENWQCLGMLSNTKPSCIFRVKPSHAHESVVMEIGLSLEPLAQVEAQTLAAPAPPSNSTGLVQRVAEHAFNYLSSFVRPACGFDPNLPVIPLKSLEEWQAAALRKLALDPQAFSKSD